jgi:hypothetical protein
MKQNLTFDNLDCMRDDELREYIKAMRHAMLRERSVCMKRIYRNLISYARLKEEAMFERENGNIQMAISLERVMDRIYKKLPKFWRW